MGPLSTLNITRFPASSFTSGYNETSKFFNYFLLGINATAYTHFKSRAYVLFFCEFFCSRCFRDNGFWTEKRNSTVFSSHGPSSALLPAMLRAEWCYCVAKFLVNGCVKAIITQLGGMTET